jgi:hypothetical protein
MIDTKALQRAIIVGTVLQVAMVIVGHFSAWVAQNVFMFGGMMISATVGYFYALDIAKGFGRGALGGAIAGGVCALLGIAVSVVLGDTQAVILALGTAISVLTGAVGRVFGQIAAIMQGKRG